MWRLVRKIGLILCTYYHKYAMSDISVSTLYRLLTFKWNYSVEISAECIQKNASGNEQKLAFSKISQLPEIRYGFLWDKIVLISSDLASFTISGIKKRESKNSLSKISQQIEGFYLKQIRPAYEQISGSTESFKSIFNNRYGRHSDVERWKNQNAVLAEKLNNNFALSFISEQERADVFRFLSLFSSCHDVRESKNQKFVAGELSKYQDFFDKVENNPLTNSQRLACVINEDNNLVLAGAGSGKTSVIIAKAGYLIQSGLAQPHEILILAYGRKASKETDERIKEKLPDIEGVTSSTFHKLGLDIIGQATGIKPRVSKFQEDTAEFYKLINNIITDLTKSEKAYNQRVIDYLVTHLIPYKDQLEYDLQGDYFFALKECNLQSIKSKIEWAEKKKGSKNIAAREIEKF